jgi:hypothetical protein
MIPAKAMHLLKRCRENPYKVWTEADMKQVVRDMEKEALTTSNNMSKTSRLRTAFTMSGLVISVATPTLLVSLMGFEGYCSEYLESSPFANANNVLPVTSD